MPQWIWQHPKWPHFTWENKEIEPHHAQARLAQGKLLGVMESFTDDTREKINIQALTSEMITTSAIEGANIDRNSVCSSIYHRLGIKHVGFKGTLDRYIEGLLDIMLDATDQFQQPLSIDRLHSWHAALFPTGYSGIQKITAGQLRGER